MSKPAHKPRDAIWVFWWVHLPNRAYPTSIVSYTRKQCIAEATACLSEPWRKVYRQGGRILRCNIVPQVAGEKG